MAEKVTVTIESNADGPYIDMKTLVAAINDVRSALLSRRTFDISTYPSHNINLSNGGTAKIYYGETKNNNKVNIQVEDKVIKIWQD